MSDILLELTEAMKRPGLMGVVGKSIEVRCRRDLAGYFKNLAADIAKLKLEDLVDQPVILARHAVEMKLTNVLRRHSAVLKTILETNLQDAYMKGWKIAQVHEADQPNPFGDQIDFLGPSGQAAATYAGERAGQQIKGVNDTTLLRIQDAIEEGITEQLGVPGTARLLRQVMGDMPTSRAEMIASTEMNDAMSQATLDKLDGLGVEYVRWIVSPDACDDCLDNEDEVVPLGDLFPSGDERPPVHPNCRCAIVGARAPSD